MAQDGSSRLTPAPDRVTGLRNPAGDFVPADRRQVFNQRRRDTMTAYEWSDKLGPRQRQAWLLLVKDDTVHVFTGRNIPDVVVVTGHDHEKAGVWSHTTYRLLLAPGVRPIAGHSGFETGRFVEGLGSATRRKTPDTWAEVSDALGVSVPSAMKFLREWRPRAAEALDEVERSIEALESATDSDSEIVVVQFGAPTRRQAAAGYWDGPFPVPGYDGAEIHRIESVKGWTMGNIEVVGVPGRVLSVEHSSGMRGGYYAVSVAIVQEN
jgi:hypothetical protein